MARVSNNPAPRTRLGCGYLLVAVIITCVLLTINGLIVTNAYYTALMTMPANTVHPRLGQAIVFVGPVLLLFVEWWAFDVITDWLAPRRAAKKA